MSKSMNYQSSNKSSTDYQNRRIYNMEELGLKIMIKKLGVIAAAPSLPLKRDIDDHAKVCAHVHVRKEGNNQGPRVPIFGQDIVVNQDFSNTQHASSSRKSRSRGRSRSGETTRRRNRSRSISRHRRSRSRTDSPRNRHSSRRSRSYSSSRHKSSEESRDRSYSPLRPGEYRPGHPDLSKSGLTRKCRSRRRRSPRVSRRRGESRPRSPRDSSRSRSPRLSSRRSFRSGSPSDSSRRKAQSRTPKRSKNSRDRYSEYKAGKSTSRPPPSTSSRSLKTSAERSKNSRDRYSEYRAGTSKSRSPPSTSSRSLKTSAENPYMPMPGMGYGFYDGYAYYPPMQPYRSRVPMVPMYPPHMMAPRMHMSPMTAPYRLRWPVYNSGAALNKINKPATDTSKKQGPKDAIESASDHQDISSGRPENSIRNSGVET